MHTQELHYRIHGSGNRDLICFHGFGQDQDAFSSYLHSLQGYRVFLFDLYYHGESSGSEQQLSQEEWLNYFNFFLEKEQIHTFSLLSFSLGGRFSLSLFPNFYKRIDHIILLAPDGIIKPFWYRVATNRIGNIIFKRLMTSELLFERTLKFMEKTHLASTTLVRFARKELATHQRRQQVYQTWTYFTPLQPTLTHLKGYFEKFNGEAHAVLGEKDAILQVSKMADQLKVLPNLKIHIIDAKHHQMIFSAKSLVFSLLKGE